jgi:hypothetical protein
VSPAEQFLAHVRAEAKRDGLLEVVAAVREQYPYLSDLDGLSGDWEQGAAFVLRKLEKAAGDE